MGRRSMKSPPTSILIINQPWSNHGDEAAHKAFVRMLRRRFPDTRISVLVFRGKIGEHELELFRPPEVPNLEYVWLKRSPPGGRLRWASRLPARLRMGLLLASPTFRQAKRLMREADLIVSAPSGADLGPYRNWRYLSLLLLALASGSPTAIYSISFSPLPEEDAADDRFSRLAVEVLTQVDFLSLREATSQQDADRRGIRYVKAFDTAFIDSTRSIVPPSIGDAIGSPYILLVPNDLRRWHAGYASYSAETFDQLYFALAESALEKTEQVILMPQLFGRQNDSDYCQAIREQFDREDRDRIYVVPEHHSSEVQQALIAGAEMVVGARTHSIVFAIQNLTPFLALSYEPKIKALLDESGLGAYMVDLQGSENVDAESTTRLFDDIYGRRCEVRKEIADSVIHIRATAEGAAEAFVDQFGKGAA